MVWNTRMPTLGPQSAHIFRITHVDNVRWMLRHGMRCRSSSTQDPNFVRIGNAELIEKRRDHAVPVPPGGTLGDYVPFYFTPHSIMLYAIKTGYHGVPHVPNRDIAIMVSSLHKLSGLGRKFVFTDSHAYGMEAEYYNDLADLDKIDWDVLRSGNFRHDPEDPGRKGRYQAEALVHKRVPVEAILGIACHDADVKERLLREAAEEGVAVPTKVLPNWYF